MHGFIATILLLFTASLACAEAQVPIKGAAPEKLNAFKPDTSYYPELNDRGELARDLDNMKSSSIRIIRMLEFAWTKLEPREGEYHFEWLDDFLNLAHERGKAVILCTPSGTPPAWMSTQYPEILVVPRDGWQRTPGGRCARTKITTFETPADLIVTPHLSDPSKCWVFNYGSEAREWNGTTIPAKEFRCLVITVKPR
ncbi:MAG: beta-galactosidase [Gloeobacteraceae cyanobacterium ES-bin-144]|nr:beta-galactosidase [Verrucomicrobiales bacterium]